MFTKLQRHKKGLKIAATNSYHIVRTYDREVNGPLGITTWDYHLRLPLGITTWDYHLGFTYHYHRERELTIKVSKSGPRYGIPTIPYCRRLNVYCHKVSSKYDSVLLP